MPVTTTYSWQLLQNLDPNFPTSGGDVTALSGGRFGILGNHSTHIDGEIFGTNNLVASSWTSVTGSNGALAQLSNGNIVVASLDSDATSLFTILNGTTGAVVVATTDIADVDQISVDVAALTGGGFWLVQTDEIGAAGGDADIDVLRYNNDGTLAGSFTIDLSTQRDIGARIAALDGGGAVIAWTREVGAETEVWYAVYNSTGGTVLAPTLLDTTGTINRNVSVTAMNGGGFAIAYEDNGWTGTVDITVATFNSSGGFTNWANVSGTDSSTDADPELTRLSNGMLVVSYGNNSFSDTDTLVRLLDPSTLALLATRYVTAGQSIVDDTDFAALAGFGLGRVAVIQTNITDGNVDGEVLQAVRTSTGDALANDITGDDLRDVMFGGDGNDTLDGWTNDDELNGGNGVDTLLGWTGNDTLNGGADPDYLYGEGGDDRLGGGSGNDTLVGGAGNDLIFGDAGTDYGTLGITSGSATWNRNPDGSWTVVSSQGVDTFYDVEFLDFSNRDVYLARAPTNFNGDGVSDLLWRNNNTGAISLWLIDQNRNITNGGGFASAAGWSPAGTGFFNGDNIEDIIWQTNGVISLWLMDSSQQPSNGGSWAIPVGWGVDEIGDFNGDGISDLLLRNSTTGQLSIWRFSPSQAISDGGSWSLGTEWDISQTGDFNSDGITDLLLRSTSGATTTWLFNGLGQPSNGASWFVGAGWNPQETGDFNRDGVSDILWRNSSTGATNLWLLDQNQNVTNGGSWVVGTEWSVADVGDFNGDGISDIMWRSTSGVLTLWLFDQNQNISDGGTWLVPPEWGTI